MSYKLPMKNIRTGFEEVRVLLLEDSADRRGKLLRRLRSTESRSSIETLSNSVELTKKVVGWNVDTLLVENQHPVVMSLDLSRKRKRL